MIENSSADDRTDDPYVDVVGATAVAEAQILNVSRPASASDQPAVTYVRDVVGAKGPSDEPALDVIEYVQYVTSDERRRQKETVNMRLRTAIPR